MLDGERLVAEQRVPIHDGQTLSVRISQHLAEEFWRVQVGDSATARGFLTTTVGAGDSFLMKLIDEAVGGKQSAWRHLAQWGHSRLIRPTLGWRTVAV
jgi:hypothetical protein